MEPDSPTWVGSPCGLHGPYVFYKAFRFHLDGKRRILSLGDFFLVRCLPGEPLCIAELQLLWEERTNQQLLSSSKLYFLPEDTPQGRTVNHGEDEVIAVSEKVIVRLEDLVKWTVWDSQAWSRGMKAIPLKRSVVHRDGAKTEQKDPHFLRYRDSTLNSGLNFKDVLKEKAELGEDLSLKRVLVLSYPQYCRYRSVLARLRERPPSLLTDQVVLALGGIAALSDNTHILYCRDTFDHPTLLHNESVCDEFAPNLKGRPRKKKPSISLRRDSQSQGQGWELKGHCQTSLTTKETGTTEGRNSAKVRADKAAISKPKGSSSSNGSSNSCSNVSSNISSKRTPSSEKAGGEGGGEECRAEEQAFLVSLYKYMKERKTPIERIPYLGFKQINLWTMFQAAQKLGGYELITARRQWKNVYDELGGNPGSTSAATCTRRHYERLILPYERFTKGEEDKPLPQTKPRKQEAGSSAESPGDVSGHTPKTKLTNGLKQPAQKPHPERDVALATKVQDKNASESVDKVSRLNTEPQIFMTRLDPPQLPHTKQERQSPGEENAEKGKEIQLILNEEKERRKRRSSGCEPSYLPTPAVTNESVLPFGTPKVLNHSHPAMDIWQQDQAAVKDQCHVGMISPTLKLRSLQSPTVPDPPSERANLPRREETYLGFTSILYPPRVNPQIMSPLAKKKLLSQVSGTGVPNHNHFPSSFGPPPPLISSSLTNGINEEPVGQPVTAMDSSVAVLNRPSVIQHAQSFKLRGMDERYDGVQRDRGIEREERAPSPTRSHEHHLPASLHLSNSHSYPEEPYQQRPSPPMLAPEMPRPSRTPPGFISDLYSPSSHLQSLYRKVESHPSQGKGQGPEQKLVPGPTEVDHMESKHQQKSFPTELAVGAESQQHYKRHQQHHGSSFSNELSNGESKRCHQQRLSLPKDTESSASFLPVVAHHEQTYSTNIHLQDKSNNSNHPRTAPTDDQPTDLSLPKSSSLKPHPQASSSHPLPQPMMHKESTHLPNDATSPPVFQNGHRAHGTAYQPRACRVPPMTVSTAHTPALVRAHTPTCTHTPRQDTVADSHPRATEKTVNSQVSDRIRVEGQGGEMGGERERTEVPELYNKIDDPNHAVRPILGSKVTPQNICAARPLKRPLEELENGTSERKIRAVTPMHASSLSSSSLSAVNLKDAIISSSPPRKTRTPEELDDDSARASAIMKSAPVVVTDAMHTAHVHIGSSFVEGNVGGPKGSTAAPFPLLPTPTTPHIYPTALYPAGAFALSQVPDLCRDTLRTSLTTGYPPSSHSHPHHPLQYLKNQSAAVLSPLVPPFAIHSFMMQRQLLAQAAASPTHMYQHPVAAATSYGELLHHGLYPMSINPQPTFSPPQLSSVHPSTKLS